VTKRVYFEDLITYTRSYYGRVAAITLAVLMIPTRVIINLKGQVR
jgi:hypothetical protein